MPAHQKKSMQFQRRKILKLLATGSLGAAGLAGIIQQSLAMANRPIRQGVNRLKGKAWINNKPAKVGMTVGAGDKIRTGKNSQIIFVVGNDAFMLRANSVLQLNGKNYFIDAMRIISGGLLSVYENARGHRRITTTVATIGIRGTGIYIETDNEKTYVCTCYGEAELIPSANKAAATVVKTTHHEQPRMIYKDRAEGLMEKGMVKNHTDDELFMLEALVNRYPPFEETSY